MRTLISPKLFLSSIFQLKKTKAEGIFPASKNDASLTKDSALAASLNEGVRVTHEVGVFDDYLDVIEALEELELAGLNLSKINLIAGDGWRCHWLSDLNICDRFNQELFESNRTTQDFFQQLFEQGKYLLLLRGTQNELNFARQIIDRCQVPSEIWYF